MSSTRTPLSNAGRAYVSIVAIAGSGVVLHSLYFLATTGIGFLWFVLAGLTLLSGSFTIRIPTIPARLSVSETFVFATALLFGPAAATITVVLDTLIISLWLRRPSRSLPRVLFNMAAPAIAIWVATHTFFALAAVPPLTVTPQPILSLVVPLVVLAILYFLLNSLLIAGAVGFEKSLSALIVWRRNFLWLSLNYFSGASVAALLLPYLQNDEQTLVRVGVILVPPLLISYLTFKTALGRVDDAHRHLTELNRLYLSTIETLAMAIDAKDQITHGHIRRVQHYAVGLARKLGVTDERQIKAIEAASLLHDMGKLAVPEYILNKPGKLTPAEFEKMKLHASVGADILSAIDFPYPVVPIVRHHHESWDGTGYPDGLKGSDIPIGARILSVVDCFDALTSDRPYRPRLPDAEAIRILLDRRGAMYDPLVVDTFIAVYADIAPHLTDQQDTTAQDIVRKARTSHKTHFAEIDAGFEDIAAGTEETIVLFELSRSLSGQDSIAAAGDSVAKHIRRVIPASTSVFYTYDVASDELVAVHAVGEHSHVFLGIHIPRGQRLSGWVAANRQTILNSDPVLDLGEIARSLKPRLLSCMSTPIVERDLLIGVLTLYSVHPEAFSEDHRRVLEVVARQIAPAFRPTGTSLGSDRGAIRRPSSLQETLDADAFADSSTSGALTIVLFRVLPRTVHTRDSTIEKALAECTAVIRENPRASAIFFRVSSDEIVVLLPQATERAMEIGRRMADRLSRRCQEVLAREFSSITLEVGVSTAPEDGNDLDTLVAAARQRTKNTDNTSPGPTSIH